MATSRRAALYVRVSTSDRGQTVENQLQPLQEAAGRLGWTVVAIYRDEGISGTKGRDKRPGLTVSRRCTRSDGRLRQRSWCRMTASIAFAALTLMASNAGGRPPTRPRARLAASAVRVRSRKSSTSNCPRAAKIWRISRPVALVVSIARGWDGFWETSDVGRLCPRSRPICKPPLGRSGWSESRGVEALRGRPRGYRGSGLVNCLMAARTC